ncbi:MATE family efflux transporter [Noviherbaspirillum galbum]|uniref:Multidrug-efflux transporter n=1 Tax=Noviherbaspirillum galbum TaxID=2709383 RepID=A0A6B3STI7_9BURK|nr:MATE family efflux transporter [Noviherbaspirillum galbum]NEX64083.1 MATE family efflux transporter [Noviherbaspirillum galbum]
MSSLSKERWKTVRAEMRALWVLAWPVLIGQLANVGMGVADVAMTGHVGAEDLAAVSLGASVWTMTLVSVIGIMMAVNAVIAHEMGGGRTARVPHVVRQAAWLGLLTAIVACAALNLSTLVFDHLSLDAAVQRKAEMFVHVISVGMPPFAAYRALYGYSASLHHTKPLMFISLGGLGFNVFVNWLLVYGNAGFPRLGAVGCAVSTGLCMWLMLGAMVAWIARSGNYRSTYPFTHWEKPNWKEISSTLRMGLPIGITYFAEVSAFASVALLVARFGVVTVSAHQIALNFASLVFMVPMSVGIALITRVGHALGEGDAVRGRLVAWVGVGMAVAFAVLSASAIALFPDLIAAAYTSDRAVQEMTVHLLLLAALFQLSDATQVSASSAIRGYKVTRPPMFIHLASFWGIAIPLGCILGLAPSWLPFSPAEPLSATGFWIGLVIGLTVAAVLLVWFLQKLSTEFIRRSAA